MTAIRVVMHVHSEWSYDAAWPLARIARMFERLGAGLVMMSEHDDGFDQARYDNFSAACATASTPRTRLIPGIEYSSPDNSVHILTWGLSCFHGQRRPVMDILKNVTAEGGVAVLAHPMRRDALAQFRDAWVEHLSAIEIWNRKTDRFAPNPKVRELQVRAGLPGVTGIDFHGAKHLFPLYNRLTLAPGSALPEQPHDVARLLRQAMPIGEFTPMAFGVPLSDPHSRRSPASASSAMTLR